MIFPSLVPLLDGLARLEGRHRGFLSFVAVDSSFRVDFRVMDRAVELSRGGRTLGRPPLTDLVHAVMVAADEFAAREVPGLPTTDAGRQDLEASLAEFRRLLSSHRRDDGRTEGERRPVRGRGGGTVCPAVPPRRQRAVRRVPALSAVYRSIAEAKPTAQP